MLIRWSIRVSVMVQNWYNSSRPEGLVTHIWRKMENAQPFTLNVPVNLKCDMRADGNSALQSIGFLNARSSVFTAKGGDSGVVLCTPCSRPSKDREGWGIDIPSCEIRNCWNCSHYLPWRFAHAVDGFSAPRVKKLKNKHFVSACGKLQSDVTVAMNVAYRRRL